MMRRGYNLDGKTRKKMRISKERMQIGGKKRE
jgi:hypothetical protein